MSQTDILILTVKVHKIFVNVYICNICICVYKILNIDPMWVYAYVYYTGTTHTHGESKKERKRGNYY